MKSCVLTCATKEVEKSSNVEFKNYATGRGTLQGNVAFVEQEKEGVCCARMAALVGTDHTRPRQFYMGGLL